VLKHCPSFHTITPCDSSGAASDDVLPDNASDDSTGGGRSPSVLMRTSLMSTMSGLGGMGGAEIGVEDVLALHQALPLPKVGGTVSPNLVANLSLPAG
jgi:hypothetical protein